MDFKTLVLQRESTRKYSGKPVEPRLSGICNAARNIG
jgi:hypothetical protein